MRSAELSGTDRRSHPDPCLDGTAQYSVLRRQKTYQTAESLVFAVWWVADAEIDLRAVVENAAGIGVSPETPFAVVLAHSGIPDAAEWQVMDDRLKGAFVDSGITGCR